MSGKDIPLFELAGEERTATPLPRVRRGVTFDSSLRPDEKAICRFWSNVVCGPGSACWLWVGPISTPDGYGRFSWQVGGHRRTVSAHRFALMISTGKEIGYEAVERKLGELRDALSQDDVTALHTLADAVPTYTITHNVIEERAVAAQGK